MSRRGAIWGGAPLDSHDIMFRALARLLSLLLFRALKRNNRNNSTKRRKYQPSQALQVCRKCSIHWFFAKHVTFGAFYWPVFDAVFSPTFGTPQPASFPPIEQGNDSMWKHQEGPLFGGGDEDSNIDFWHHKLCLLLFWCSLFLYEPSTKYQHLGLPGKQARQLAVLLKLTPK